MNLLLTSADWQRRAQTMTGELATLADGIAADLEPVLARPLYVPAEKALLTREGGRCPGDGTLLEFDPFDEHHHRCSACGESYGGERHRGFWRYWYHLWLAERAVHAAVSYRLRGDDRHATLAAAVLDGYADRYLEYPNVDNVLGPARPFFSTYLESIWLLQLCIALDALEGADPGTWRALGARVRERIIEPSAALIASYDEGMSNRQVWNVASQMAAARLLGRGAAVPRLIEERHGLAFLIAEGCLADGTWFEGENYHMFAHRGLWYGVTMAAAAGMTIDAGLLSRFDKGFAAPFLTALPDMTLPSRRDSQYAVSLRQPRFAEMCELGLARREDPRLHSVLASLYGHAPELAAGDNGRARSSADVERNLPATRLTRADLGWRALLFARETLPLADPVPLGSVLLEGQGIAVLRRDRDRIYVALDYGISGGGHGHPDRLNVLLSDATTRWLDDFGTGSYVERTLHWYRSTLAHNAPLVDGRSQSRGDGALLAYEDRGGAGWVHAAYDHAAPGVRLERTLVVMPDHMIDELTWSADREVTVDLPVHAPLTAVSVDTWTPAEIAGGAGLEDGFAFVTSSAVTTAPPGATLLLAAPADGLRPMQAAIASDGDAEWWRFTAPAAPGRGDHVVHLVRSRGSSGRVRAVWSWAGGGRRVEFAADRIIISAAGDVEETHSRTTDGWHIDLRVGGATSSIDLGGVRPRSPGLSGEGSSPEGFQAPVETVSPTARLVQFTLGRLDYRRSEQSWEEAGEPGATGTIEWDGRLLTVRVGVRKSGQIVFVPDAVDNPLDNEPAEINGDGVQVYVLASGRAGAWTIVPVAESPVARARPVVGWTGLDLAGASWAATPGGYEIVARVVAPGDPHEGLSARVGLIVNETADGRARRRGQLVLGGAEGEWVYLRGDRHDPARLLPVRLVPGDLS